MSNGFTLGKQRGWRLRPNPGCMSRRGVSGLIALLVLAGQQAVVAADAAPERYVFYLAAQPSRSPDDLCVGDVLRINVKAERFIANKRATNTEMNTSPPVQVYGVTLNGAVGNAEIGSLNTTTQVTSARSTPPGSTIYNFTAAKAGFTTIVFTGVARQTGWFAHFASDRPYLSAEIEVTVNDCEYSVTATSHWSGFNLRYTALVSDVRMKSTGAGKYTGDGTWTFMITTGGECPNTQFFEARVELTGYLDGGELTVFVTYDWPVGTWFHRLSINRCVGGGSETMTQSAESLTFPVSAQGGSLSLPQTLRDITGAAVYELPGGQVRVTVLPVVVK